LTRAQLIETGKKRGYVLYSDFDELLPDDCEGGPELDDLLSALENAGVEILVAPDIKVGKAPDPAEYTDDVMQVYLREMCKVPQLTRDKEIELSKLILFGKPHEAEAAKVQLVEANLRLVVPVAERYANGPVHLLELIQEENNGLMKAAGTFDYRHGYKFSTYATWWARRFIIRATR